MGNVTAFLPVFVVLVPIVAIIGGISVAIASIISNGKVRELRIRERIALIEKGLVPRPEVDPAGFDLAMGRHDKPGGAGGGIKPALRRAGVMVISIGFGLMLLIGVTGNSPRTAIGVGGFLVIVGAAFLVNSLFESGRHAPMPAGRPSIPAPSKE